jgi:type IV pilus assembly protein PilO
MSSSASQALKDLSYPKALVIAIFLGAFYYFRMYDDGSALERQISDARANTSAEEEKKKETDKVKAEEDEIKNQVGALAEKFKEVTARFPINLKSDEIISTINTLARTTNVRVISVKKESIEEKELYDEVPVSLELSGTFNNLLLLMYNIASLEKVTNLGDFEFSNTGQDYDGTLKLVTKAIGYKYRKPPEKTIGPDGMPLDPNAPPPAGGGI